MTQPDRTTVLAERTPVPTALTAILAARCARLPGEPSLPPPGTVGRAAFLMLLTRPQADVGQIMQATAALGGNDIGSEAEVAVYDSGGTDASAVAAAQAAVAGGAQMLLGPLLSGQSCAVEAAVGRVPVVALTNDRP